MQPSFQTTHRDHAPAIARLVAGYLPPGQDREDLSQDIWLAIWKALPRFRGDSSSRTYILRIAHNRATTWIVRKRALELSDAVEAVSDSRPSPEAAASSRRDVEQLMTAIRTLPTGQSQALTLVLEGLSHAEVGAILNLSESAVGVRLHRARKQQRISLGAHHG